MIAVFKHELKLNLKSLLIWSLSVGGMGFVCILMYTSMEGEMANMADTFSNLGAFSEAFGMSTLSIATISGFFATEVGVVHGLGSAMFSALMATVLLSKEEDGHTGEFLYSLPVSRGSAVTAKILSLVSELALFTLICGAFYVAGFIALGEDVPVSDMTTFLLRMLVMNMEVSAVALVISAASAKNRIGTGLGISLIFYAYDLVGRVVPDMKDWLFLGPFSLANASEIFAGYELPVKAVVTALIVTAFSVVATFGIYLKKDLAA